MGLCTANGVYASLACLLTLGSNTDGRDNVGVLGYTVVTTSATDSRFIKSDSNQEQGHGVQIVRTR